MMARLRAPRLVEIVLVLSLVLNVCVASGFAYSRYADRDPPAPLSPERRLELIAERLGLNPARADNFQEWRQSLKTSQGSLIQQNRPLIEEAWQELIKPQPDTLRIQALLDQMSLHRRAFQTDTTASLIRFLGSLTTEQRVTFMKIALDRKDPIGQPVRSSLGN